MSDIPEVFAIFEQKLAHVLSFNLRQKGQKKAIEELLAYFSGIVERASKAESRIAELSQAVGLMTTLKPTMVMDTDHPLDMAKEVAEYVNTRIAELEAAQRWIPVSEGLPEDCERVWVRATNSPQNLPRRAFHTYRNGKWVNDEVDIDNVYSNLNVTHWMPLPEPPEAQE